jgi:lipoprotein-releasing system permease protein
MKKMVIEGIYKSDIPEQELHVIYTRSNHVRSFLRQKDILSQLEIQVKDFDQATELGDQLKKNYDKEYFIQDWKDMNSHLFASLKLERIAMFIGLGFIVLVASFNIVTTLSLMVMEKKRDIAILSAMGASSEHIGAVFLSEGLFIGTFGVIGGLALGYGFSYLLKHYEIPLPSVYYDRKIPIQILLEYYLKVGVFAFITVLAACIYPALKAAKTSPLKGLKS